MHFVFKYRLIENGKFGHFLFFHLCLSFNAEDYLQMKTIIKSTQHTKRYAIFSINTDKYQIPIYGDFHLMLLFFQSSGLCVQSPSIIPVPGYPLCLVPHLRSLDDRFS